MVEDFRESGHIVTNGRKNESDTTSAYSYIIHLQGVA